MRAPVPVPIFTAITSFAVNPTAVAVLMEEFENVVVPLGAVCDAAVPPKSVAPTAAVRAVPPVLCSSNAVVTAALPDELILNRCPAPPFVSIDAVNPVVCAAARAVEPFIWNPLITFLS